MQKYAKIINEKTKECSVGLGTNDSYYQSIKMTLMDVEQAYNGQWYLVGYVPQEPIEDKQKEVRAIRNDYLSKYDFTQLVDAPFTEQEKEKYAQYRQYLRDYTNQENWWEQNPLTFEEWSATNAF